MISLQRKPWNIKHPPVYETLAALAAMALSNGPRLDSCLWLVEVGQSLASDWSSGPAKLGLPASRSESAQQIELQ